MNPFACGALGRGGHRCSSRWSIAVSSRRGRGLEQVLRGFSCPFGIARGDRIGELAIGLRAGRPRRPSQRPARPARAHRWREACCTSAGTRSSRRRRQRGPRTSARGAAARRGRPRRPASAARHRAAQPVPGAAAGPPARRPWARCAAGSRGCCARPTRSSSPARTSKRGSRSSPAWRRKSRTVVASP